MFYAHSVEGKTASQWHRLEEHLKGTEGTVPDLRTERSEVVESGLSLLKRCVADFAAEFGSRKWEYLAGLWHEMRRVNLE